MSTTEQPPVEQAGGLLDGFDWTGKIYTDGWVDAPVTIDTYEPATGELLGSAGAADAETIARASELAAKVQPEWASTLMTERIAILERVADGLRRHHDEILQWMIRESGCIPPKGSHEIGASIGQIQLANSLINATLGHVLPSITPGRTSTAMRVPIGVVGVICPWNFPVVLAMRSLAPALVLGNTVILKSDPNTPVCGGVLLARLFEEAGLPKGVLQVVCGDADTGQAMCEDPRIRMISFTGSTAAGRKVGETCGRTLKRVVLELGGNSPLIVLDDADIDVASSAGAWGSFGHQGQICLATSRHIVHENVIEAYLEALVERAKRLPVGNPATDEVALGPLINSRQVQRVQRIVDESIAQGAAALTGGKPDGPFFPATVLADVSPTMPAFAEEIFGPVAPVVPFRTDEEAIALANDTEYGLTAAVQGSVERAQAIADRLHAGMVHVNDTTVNEEPPAPFGGFGASGNGGHFGGVTQLEQWTEWQWRTSRAKGEPFPF
ncbi:MAG: benzaldehyde dehydrogenase [Solirubrobacteraceae bacterium]|nr:benzaldehyde dehydrogenase [Solirubrobacteraceae bacterium]